jgi:hypothetical protein
MFGTKSSSPLTGSVMSIASYSIRSQPLFPFPFKAMGAGIILVSILFFDVYFFPFAMLLGGFFLSGHRGVQFDFSQKRVRDYYSFWYLKFGTWNSLVPMEKLFIVASKVTKTYNSRYNNSSQVTTTEFDAYLKFQNGQKLYLATRGKKAPLEAVLNPLASQLQLPLEDFA